MKSEELIGEKGYDQFKMRYSPSFFESAKRRVQTEKCEKQLQRVVKSKKPAKAILEAAEQVRLAKLAELKAKEELALFGGQAGDGISRRLSNIAAAISKWSEISACEIIRRYSR